MTDGGISQIDLSSLVPLDRSSQRAISLPTSRRCWLTGSSHTYAEFVLKDADAALTIMTENPYVLAGRRLRARVANIGSANIAD
jgi:hypothetical protein